MFMTFATKNCIKIHRFLIDIRHHRKSEGSYLAVIYEKEPYTMLLSRGKTLSIPEGNTLSFGL